MKLDLHVHSHYSKDSLMEPRKIVEVAKMRGLSGVAVADHGSLQGGLETAKHAGDDFIVIPGIEVTTKVGHIVGLFVTEPVQGSDPEEVIERIHEQNGIAVLPHPLRTLPKLPPGLIGKFDAIEGFNARRSSLGAPDPQYGEKKIGQVLQQCGLALLGVSDAHFYIEIGRGTTEVEGTSAEDVKSAIHDRKTLICGKHTSFVYRLLSGTLRLVGSPAGGVST